MGAVMQVLMRSDIPAAKAFLYDHLRVPPAGQKFGGQAWSASSASSFSLAASCANAVPTSHLASAFAILRAAFSPPPTAARVPKSHSGVAERPLRRTAGVLRFCSLID